MSTYPLLITRLQDPYSVMGDLYRARYTQGSTVHDDVIDSLEPVSDYPGVSEADPRWSGDRAFFRMEDLLLEERPGQLPQIWAREDLGDYVPSPNGVYYTSDGVLYALKKPGARAQRIDVPAPLSGGVEAGLVLGTERGLLRFDPATGEGAELARGPFGDFSVSGNRAVYSDGSAVRTRDLETGDDTLVVPGDGVWRLSPRFSPDQSRIFYCEAWFPPDFTLRTRLQVVENRPDSVPRTLLDQAIEAVPP